MNAMVELIVGLLAAVPLLGLLLLWRRRPRARGRALIDVVAAVPASVLILMIAGAVLDPEAVSAATFLPVIISGSVVAVSANRMVNRPSAGPNASR